MQLGLEGRVALITGPAKGMGAAISLAFAEEGCDLGLLGRDTAAGEKIAALLPPRSGAPARETVDVFGCGFPGVEPQMPLMLTQVNAGRLTLEHYVCASAEATSG